jgi:hypothetical protein
MSEDIELLLLLLLLLLSGVQPESAAAVIEAV